MRRMTLLVIAVSIIAAPNTSVARPDVAQHQCPTAQEHNRYARYVLQFSDNNGDYHASRPTAHQLRKLALMRSCAKQEDAIHPFWYPSEHSYWKHRSARWAFYKHIDEITVYGKWAIPEYIVMRESHGHKCAKNPHSTAGGYYQFLTTTWQAYGGIGSAQCAPDWEQHEIAARAWDGGRGSNNWALTR